MERRIGRRWILPQAALLLGLALPPALAGDADRAIGEEVELKGVVVERSGDVFLLQDAAGVETEVRLGSGVEIQEKKKNFLREGLRYSAEDVVAGLRLEVEGHWGPTGAVEARKIKFTQDDLKVARVVDSRLVPMENRLVSVEDEAEALRGHVDELGYLSRQNQEDARQARQRAEEAMLNADAAHRRVDDAENEIGVLERRFEDLANYDVHGEATVLFKAGSATLSPEAMKVLDDFAASLEGQPGFLLEVMGYASADGNEDFNRRLSEGRTASVIRYLTENQRIEPRHFVNPHGYGENRPVADNDTRDGRIQNRRVEVRLLVNRAFQEKAEGLEQTAYSSSLEGGIRP